MSTVAGRRSGRFLSPAGDGAVGSVPGGDGSVGSVPATARDRPANIILILAFKCYVP